MNEPTNRTPTCVVCGDPIDESKGEVPCYIEPSDQDDYGEHDGEAYHLNKCEDGIFDEVIAQVDTQSDK